MEPGLEGTKLELGSLDLSSQGPGGFPKHSQVRQKSAIPLSSMALEVTSSVSSGLHGYTVLIRTCSPVQGGERGSLTGVASPGRRGRRASWWSAACAQPPWAGWGL